MGSVKHVRKDDLGARLHIEGGSHTPGRDAWKVTGAWSAGDLKQLMPDVEVPGKGAALAMMAGKFWEDSLENSLYLGMMDARGVVVSVEDLLDRGELSDTVVMSMVNTPEDTSEEGLREYQRKISEGELGVFVADAEFIWRSGVPLGSSVFKRIFNKAGFGDEWLRVADYDGTVEVLEEIRDLHQSGHVPEVDSYLKSLGLSEVPNPGTMLPDVSVNYTTKFSRAGDQDITREQVPKRLGLNQYEFDRLEDFFIRCVREERIYSEERGIVNYDGKREISMFNGVPVFTDFAHTPDENRTMIIHTVGDKEFLLPTNKELGRAILREAGVYRARHEAIRNHGEEWRGRFFDYMNEKDFREAANRATDIMSNPIMYIANLALGRKVFDVPDIDTWAGDVLPYASRR